MPAPPVCRPTAGMLARELREQLKEILRHEQHQAAAAAALQQMQAAQQQRERHSSAPASAGSLRSMDSTGGAIAGAASAGSGVLEA